jgi:hypothetical protein
MYTIMNASPLTLVIIVATMMVVPLYVCATYVASNASLRKGMVIAYSLLVWGAIMTWVCLAEVPRSIGLLGMLIVPVCWATPTLVLFLCHQWFLDKPLSQRWLIALQVWRVIGAVFLIEMARGNIPGIFAYPAGIGDVLVAVVAAGVLLRYRHMAEPPRGAILLVIGCGVADFVSAFFFGFTSSAGPQQLFFPAVANHSLLFPTGMIPLFLVPCALFFHALSGLTLRQERGH